MKVRILLKMASNFRFLREPKLGQGRSATCFPHLIMFFLVNDKKYMFLIASLHSNLLIDLFCWIFRIVIVFDIMLKKRLEKLQLLTTPAYRV
jgi:hypothetical protein